MKIKSICMKNHKVLGNIKINFQGDSEEYTGEKSFYINIEENSKNNENIYTFIIGDNGSGKSVLLKSIVYYINEMSRTQTDKIEAYRDCDPKHSGSSLERRFHEMVSLNLNRIFEYFSGISYSQSELLSKHHSQLIFISGSSSEEIITHPNDRFLSLITNRSIINSKYLLLKALSKENYTDKIMRLNNYLNNKSQGCYIESFLSFQVTGEAETGKWTSLLYNQNNINILNLLMFIKNIINMPGDNIDYKDMSREAKSIYETLFESIMFRNIFLKYDSNIKQLFRHILSSTVINEINKFLDKVDFISADTLNLHYSQTLETNILKNYKINDLNNFEIDVLGLLEDLKLIDITVYFGEKSVDVLSSGERVMLKLFSIFANRPIYEEKENIIFLYDEPENSLHPSWQHNFMKNFSFITEDLYNIKKSHFIFATHSPLIVMNADKHDYTNVMKLYKNKKGIVKCDNIPDIATYSIEQVLLDEFKISYREQELENSVRTFLVDKNNKMENKTDPILSIEKSFKLHNKINDLLLKIKRDKHK